MIQIICNGCNMVDENVLKGCDYCEECMEEILEFIIREKILLTHQAETGQNGKKPTKKNAPIDMGKVNALREAGWSIGKIAEEMRIPTEDLAEKIFDRKVQEQESIKT